MISLPLRRYVLCRADLVLLQRSLLVFLLVLLDLLAAGSCDVNLLVEVVIANVVCLQIADLEPDQVQGTAEVALVLPDVSEAMSG